MAHLKLHDFDYLKTKSGKKKVTKPTKAKGFVFSLEGVHGVGKTTIYDLLESRFENFSTVQFFPERLRPIPPFPFGSTDKQTAFRSELHYNQQMMARNKKINEFIKSGRDYIAIADRSPISILAYSLALELPKKDYDLIQDTYLSENWVTEYIIYLEAKPETIMNRIIKRGSLEKDRLKWNEDDLNYLKLVISKYELVFQQLGLKDNKRLYRISTENKTPQIIVDEILQIISKRTAINLNKRKRVPINQSKLTTYFPKK
jgi:thymidylate kinase